MRPTASGSPTSRSAPRTRTAKRCSAATPPPASTPDPESEGEPDDLVARLRAGGVVRPEDEARALVAHAGGSSDALRRAVDRRLAGEPLPRILTSVDFDGQVVGIGPDVYIPRWTSESLARAAAVRLPADGTAVDLCTGSGAVAVALAARRPRARIVATDLHPESVACARANGVDAHLGDLFEPLAPSLRGAVDVVVAVPPFVPAEAVDLLPADVLAHERRDALDGGRDGLSIATRIVTEAPAWLRSGGSLLVEVGPDQIDALVDLLTPAGLALADTVIDPDGDPCGIAAVRT